MAFLDITQVRLAPVGPLPTLDRKRVTYIEVLCRPLGLFLAGPKRRPLAGKNVDTLRLHDMASGRTSLAT